MPVVIDQLGRSVSVPENPQRIVSLVPSQTELLHYLGLGDRVVGITKFCVHPSEWFKHKTRVGGTKDFKPERIANLEPDLIIANKEENDESAIQVLEQLYPVWISDVASHKQAIEMIRTVGSLTGTNYHAEILIDAIEQGLKDINPLHAKRAAYLIWQDPLMLAGKGTFIDANMRLAGFDNVVQTTRYPSLSLDELVGLAPEVLLYSSEPFPFAKKHIEPYQEALPHAKHILVDGEMFSWYGSRMPAALRYLTEIQHQLD